jgi:hypothetical protein
VVERDLAVITRVADIVVGEHLDDVAWTTERLGGGLGEAVGVSEGVYRLSGTGTAGRRRVPWSAVRKRLQVAEGHADPGAWDYWKREALAYQSDLLGDLAQGLAAPACYAVDVLDDDHIDIWLEDVPAEGPSPWPLARYGLAARHLGRFNGAYLSGRALPSQPWLSPGRLRHWLTLGADAAANLTDLAAHPIGVAWLTADSVGRISHQWRDRDRLLAGLDALPRVLCHHDASRRNLIAAGGPDGLERTVAIDWVGVGRGAPGEDLAGLVATSLQFLDVDPRDAGELDRIAFEGYVAGLRDAGAVIADREVRFAYAAAASLLIGVGGAAGWLGWLVEDRGNVEQAEAGIGHPLAEILARWQELEPFLLDLGDEAHRLVAQGDFGG